MRRTKIVCTLGPSTRDRDTILRLIESGMDVARINLSHGSRPEHRSLLDGLREAARTSGGQVAVLLDGQGPEVRLGRFASGPVCLEEGALFVLAFREGLGDSGIAYVNSPGLAREIGPGQRILVDDGNVVLLAEGIQGDEVHCRVIGGGWVSAGKKVSMPGVSLPVPYISSQDASDIQFAAQEGADFFAASFVRNSGDVISVKRVLEQSGGTADVIAKIETRQALEDLDNILKVADGLMVARGDLGVELEPEEVPLAQKEIIARCNARGKPVITATQMLESMVAKTRPTRAEASDVANAILDGTDAVMLSAETAVGEHPVEACAMMARIAARAESALRHEDILHYLRRETRLASVTEAISYATCAMAADLGAKAIITATTSGHTARMVAKYRPVAPVVGATPDETVLRKLLLVWGVKPLQVGRVAGTDQMIQDAIGAALKAKTINQGDLVVLSAGIPVGVPGTTNMIKVHTVGDVLLRGTGIGLSSASGMARLAKRVEDACALVPGEVLVATGTDREYTPYMEKASAIITEEAGLTSHAAIVGLSLGIPVVVGARGAMSLLHDGMEVTVDASAGLVYRGKATVL
ncbi:MAG: pyruvate kinase [Bacillota bacterium]